MAGGSRTVVDAVTDSAVCEVNVLSSVSAVVHQFHPAHLCDGVILDENHYCNVTASLKSLDVVLYSVGFCFCELHLLTPIHLLAFVDLLLADLCFVTFYFLYH